jgi:hypothetical protein
VLSILAVHTSSTASILKFGACQFARLPLSKAAFEQRCLETLQVPFQLNCPRAGFRNKHICFHVMIRLFTESWRTTTISAHRNKIDKPAQSCAAILN